MDIEFCRNAACGSPAAYVRLAPENGTEEYLCRRCHRWLVVFSPTRAARYTPTRFYALLSLFPSMERDLRKVPADLLSLAVSR